MLTETITSLDHSSKRNENSLTPYLSQWAVKMIEAARTDVGDISTGRQTRSHNQQQTSVALLTQIIDRYDPKNFDDVQRKPKWEKAM